MMIQNYHKHTSLSHRYNKDSPLVYMDYFNELSKYANEGIPTIYSTVEHGWQGNYFKIYSDLEKFNKKNKEINPKYEPIKFVFGTEAYWVKDRFEKDGTNNHIVLLAKNDNGRKKINRAIYESFNSGYYYKNRMDLDILLSLPKSDVMVTSACIGFYGYEKENNYTDFSTTDEIILKLNEHFDDFYLEVQYHNTDVQKKVNQHILDLSHKYNIPIICGLDSHVITLEQMEDREDLLRSNKISYEDEEGWYMDFPCVSEVVERFRTQGILSDDEIYASIENTSICLKFDDIILDKSLKVPVAKKYKHLTQEERNELLKNIVIDEWNKQYDDINEDLLDEYCKELKNNLKEITDCGMADYFIDTYEIVKLAQEKYGGIITDSGRGSSISFMLNKLLGFTKVDKVNANVVMYAERFMTAQKILESKTLPDIDHNVNDRQPFIQAQKDIIGEQGTFDLIAFGTLKYKSAFKMYARACGLDPELSNEVTKQISKYEEALKHADENETVDIYDYVDEKYKELIEGCQKYRGIIDNFKPHPCSTICTDFDAIEEIGVIMVKSESNKSDKGTFVAIIESGTIDEFGLLKQDYLIVDTVGLTSDLYKETKVKHMSINKLLQEIDGDKATWDIYSKGYTMCINQVEQENTTEKAIRYKPQNIVELTMFIAGIRPSFQTMYKTFESRQHFDYGIKAFDDLLQDKFRDSSFILYQEDLMKVLGFAGFPMAETYTIIKAISKKKTYVINSAKEKFIPNFAQAILDTKETDDIEVAKETADKVWQIIENSAQYGFNCVSGDTIIYNIFNSDKSYTVKELYENGLNKNNNMGFSMARDGLLYKNKIIDIYRQPKAQLYEITTISGKKIKATENHKFPTRRGIKYLKDLYVRDSTRTDNFWTNDELFIRDWANRTKYEQIKSIVPCEYDYVYDVSMSEDVAHNFVANDGIVTCNCSHAYCMAIDSVTLAWFKAHYPLEFYKVCLQRYSDKQEKDKVARLKKEMLKLGISLNPIKFGNDNRTFSIDKEHNCINSDISSIKNIQKFASQYLYEIGLEQYDDLFYVFKQLKSSELNKKTIEILFNLDYFRDYGDINYITYQWRIYNDLSDIINKLSTCKQLSKTSCEEYHLDIDKVKVICGKESAKMFKEINNDALVELFMENVDIVKDEISAKYTYTPATILDTIYYEVAYIGYTDKVDDTVNSDIYMVTDYNKNKYGSNFVTLYRIFDGVSHEYKVDKKLYNEEPIEVGDMIKGLIQTRYKKYKKDNKWVKSDKTEDVLSEYMIIKKHQEKKKKEK